MADDRETLLAVLKKLSFKALDLELRNLVVRTGSKQILDNIFTSGHAIQVDNRILSLREKLGLPRLPPTVLSSRESLKGLRKLLNR